MRYGVENLTVRTDDRRYAGRGRTQDWNAFLQRAQAGLRQMLWGSPASEPGVIGRIEKEIGAMRLVYDLPGEDDFIADLGRHAERRPPRGGRQHKGLREIGRAQVCTPVTNAHLVCRI